MENDGMITQKELLDSVKLHSDKPKILDLSIPINLYSEGTLHCSALCDIYHTCKQTLIKGNKRICLICETPFLKIGTLPNQKGFCSSKCQKKAKELYIIEEKKKLEPIIKAKTRTKQEYLLKLKEGKLEWKARKKEIFGDDITKPIVKEGFKRCYKCKRELPIASFCHNRTRKDGLHNCCKKCNSENARNWQKKYPEKYREKDRLWRLNNPNYFKEWRPKKHVEKKLKLKAMVKGL
jgi:hypothetical protein